MAEFQEINQITQQIIGAAIEVHRNLGPGLLESTYETCLAYELEHQGLALERQKTLPIVYKGIRLDQGYRLDLVVENSLIVELKAVDQIMPIHEAQILSYLKLSGHKIRSTSQLQRQAAQGRRHPSISHGLKRTALLFLCVLCARSV